MSLRGYFWNQSSTCLDDAHRAGTSLQLILAHRLRFVLLPRRAMRTLASGTFPPLPTWSGCSMVPLPSTGTPSLVATALGGTHSPKGKKEHSAEVAVVWHVFEWILLKSIKRSFGEAHRQTTAKKRLIVLFSGKMMCTVPEQVYSSSQHSDS
eukprot:2613295-Amphidinium_carterae.1